MRAVHPFVGKKSRLLLSFLGAALFLTALYFTAGIWFETNDDVLIAEMLSGKITGVPEYHCPHVGTLLTWPVTMLYRAFHAVPWWGILLFAGMFFFVFVNVYYALRYATHLFQSVAAMAVEAALMIAGIHCFGQAQYTCVAILVAFTGYVILIADRKKKWAWVAFALCELFACELRDSSMILVQPLGVLALAGFEWADRDSEFNLKRSAMKVIRCAVIAVCMLAVLKIDRTVTFHSSEWNDFYKYHTLRISLFDYEEKIPYDTLSGVLEKYGVSAEDYAQLMEYRIRYTDNKITPECVDELLPIVREIRSVKINVPRLVEAVKQLLFTSSEFWHLHQLTALFFLLLIAVTVAAGNYRMLVSVLVTFAGYFTGIVVLAYRDRFVLRVMMPYYLGTLLLLCMLFAYLMAEMGWKLTREKAAAIVAAVMVLMVVGVSLGIGRVQFAYVRAQNHIVNFGYFSDQREIMEYCKARPENRYVLDMSYAKFSSTDIFESNYYDSANHICSGSWYSNTPSLFKYSRDYIKDGCCYLVYEAQSFLGREGVDYYAEMLGAEPVLEDTVKLTGGATIWVWKIVP